MTKKLFSLLVINDKFWFNDDLKEKIASKEIPLGKGLSYVVNSVSLFSGSYRYIPAKTQVEVVGNE